MCTTIAHVPSNFGFVRGRAAECPTRSAKPDLNVEVEHEVYAIIENPDGNPVGIMSSLDQTRHFAPASSLASDRAS